MNKEKLKNPWVIALMVFAAIGLLAVGFLGSRLLLGRQIRAGFPRTSFGSSPIFADGERVGGEILTITDTQLSIELPDGEIFEFSITDETEIFSDGGLDALEVGAFAFVLYETADDGSLVALSIGSQFEGRGFRIGPPGDGPVGGDDHK